MSFADMIAPVELHAGLCHAYLVIIIVIIHTCRYARYGYIGYCLFLCVCMVTAISGEDKASSVKFCTVVH